MAIRCRLVGVLMVALESPVLVFLIFCFWINVTETCTKSIRNNLKIVELGTYLQYM